jgi:hypothetical protein
MSSFAATGQSYGFGSKATGLDLIKPVGSFALSCFEFEQSPYN